jgi:hypothetical protein
VLGPIAVGAAVGISQPVFGCTDGYASMWPVIGLPVLLAAFLLKPLEPRQPSGGAKALIRPTDSKGRALIGADPRLTSARTLGLGTC